MEPGEARPEPQRGMWRDAALVVPCALLMTACTVDFDGYSFGDAGIGSNDQSQTGDSDASVADADASEPTTDASDADADASEATPDATEPTADASEPTADATEPTADATEPTADADTAPQPPTCEQAIDALVAARGDVPFPDLAALVDLVGEMQSEVLGTGVGALEVDTGQPGDDGDLGGTVALDLDLDGSDEEVEVVYDDETGYAFLWVSAEPNLVYVVSDLGYDPLLLCEVAADDPKDTFIYSCVIGTDGLDCADCGADACEDSTCVELLPPAFCAQCQDDLDCGPDSICRDGLCLGSGELRFTLAWTGYTDLDLHVLTPDGDELYYGNSYSDTGALDRDETQGGPGAVENVFFFAPAPEGEYRYWVVNYDGGASTDFTVEVVQGSATLATQQASLPAESGAQSATFSIDWP